MTEKDPDNLSLDDIERIEKLTLRWIFQAVLDFGMGWLAGMLRHCVKTSG